MFTSIYNRACVLRWPMGYFNRDTNNRAGRDNRGGGRGFGGSRPTRNDGPREMFKTVCSSCGKECEVPFKPTNGKPVYCSECFDRISPRTDRPERNERPSFERNDRPRRDDGPRREDRPQAPRVDYGAQFESLNAKMDKLITLLSPKAEDKVSKVVATEEVKEAKAVKTPRVKKEKVVKEDKVEVASE